MRTRTFIAALALLAAIGVGDAAAQTAEESGVLGISPARRDIVAEPPTTLSPTRVSNTTETDFRMRIFPAVLSQDLDGTFAFEETPADLRAARLIFPVGPQRFDLAAGGGANLTLRWNLVPRGKKAVYMGLVVQGTPRTRGENLSQIFRLLGINFFVTPGRHRITGNLTNLTGEQDGPRVIRFKPRVRNRGEVHAEPRGRCTIVDSTGRVRFRESFGRDGVIIPGYAREFPIVLRETVLPAGSYRMTCRTRFGRRNSEIEYPFRLSGPNTLPTADLKLRRVQASGTVEEAAEVSVDYRNAGTKASPVVLKATLARSRRGRQPVPVARKTLRQEPLGAKGAREVDFDIGSLTPGSYRVTVVLSDGRTDLDTRSADFTAEPKQSLFDWLKDNLLWLLLLLILAFIGFLIWLVKRERDRRAELEQARAAAPAPPPAAAAAAPPVAPPPAPAPAVPPATPPPPPAAAPPTGSVNVNTASVDELMLLPGVGRRAAQRIVEHRETSGPFSSLEELSAIEGFHAERIRRIQESAEV